MQSYYKPRNSQNTLLSEFLTNFQGLGRSLRLIQSPQNFYSIIFFMQPHQMRGYAMWNLKKYFFGPPQCCRKTWGHWGMWIKVYSRQFCEITSLPSLSLNLKTAPCFELSDAFCNYNTQFCMTLLQGKTLCVRIIVAPTVTCRLCWIQR